MNTAYLSFIRTSPRSERPRNRRATSQARATRGRIPDGLFALTESIGQTWRRTDDLPMLMLGFTDSASQRFPWPQDLVERPGHRSRKQAPGTRSPTYLTYPRIPPSSTLELGGESTRGRVRQSRHSITSFPSKAAARRARYPPDALIVIEIRAMTTFHNPQVTFAENWNVVASDECDAIH